MNQMKTENSKKLFSGINLLLAVTLFVVILSNQNCYASEDETIKGSQASISGKVTDTGGNPMPGVNILEKGTSNGTVTNLDGNYNITLTTANPILVFSFLGFITEEIEVGEQTAINLTLLEDVMDIGEVVVTALGIKREEKALGYSVQSVGGEGLQTVKGVDLTTSLTGKVSGLLIKNTSEFALESEIEIRGEEPLIVIDGVPYANLTLRDIPSDDIEDISVLKGATASALYGYRGESGAIMVTTKKSSGKKGLSVSVNSSSMFTAGFLAIPEMQSTYGRPVSYNAAEDTYTATSDIKGSWGPPLEGQQVIQWDPIAKEYRSMPFIARGKDNFKNFLEQGYILNNNVSILQQGDNGSLRSSITWVNNKGQYPNSKFTKLTYNVGGDIKIDKFQLSSSISYNKQYSPNKGFNNYRGYDPMFSLLLNSAPDYNVLDYQDYWLVPNKVQNNSYSVLNNNPYFDRYERIHSVDKDIFNGSISLNYEILPWLKATLRSGFDVYSNQQEIKNPVGSYVKMGIEKVLDPILDDVYVPEYWDQPFVGSYNKGIGKGFSINNDFLLTANQTFGDFHVDALGGGSIFFHKDEGIQTATQGGLSIPGFYSLQASVNDIYYYNAIGKRQVNSVFGRLGLSYKSLLFVESTIRNDWSSTLPESTRSYLYPSVSSSFILSELLPDIAWMSLWKLRGSWTLSKTPARIYSINNVYDINDNAWGSISSANYPTAIRGTDVQPESSATFEVGTAINVYKNRASLDIAYYQKRFFNDLDFASISDASGFEQNYVNTDEEQTRKGIEITAKVTPVQNSNWKWDMSFNWSKYARYYTKIDSIYSNDYPWVAVGKRVDHFLAFDFLKDPDGNIIHNNNGEPQLSTYRSVFGFSDPDWIWGFSTALSYKRLTLNISVDGRVGGKTRTMTEMYMWRLGNHPNSVTPERYLDATVGGANYLSEGVQVVSGDVTYDTYGNILTDTREYAPNDVYITYETYMNRIHRNSAWGWTPPSPYDIYSTTFIKLREVSLIYQIPQEFCGLIRAKDASVSAVGQNLLLWAKDFKYSDPDSGVENLSDPSVRYLGFNLKVVF
jgi:TonB-linked SusC/RagA family outer membrane protein